MDGKIFIDIAQELREVMPELVEGLEGNLSVKTTQLIFPLIRAVQQLSARVVELEAR